MVLKNSGNRKEIIKNVKLENKNLTVYEIQIKAPQKESEKSDLRDPNKLQGILRKYSKYKSNNLYDSSRNHLINVNLPKYTTVKSLNDQDSKKSSFKDCKIFGQ